MDFLIVLVCSIIIAIIVLFVFFKDNALGKWLTFLLGISLIIVLMGTSLSSFFDEDFENQMKRKKLFYIFGSLFFFVLIITAIQTTETFPYKTEVMTTLWSVLAIHSLLLLEAWREWNGAYFSLIETFRNIIKLIEDKPMGQTTLMVIISVLIFIGIIVGSVFIGKDETSGRTSKGIGIGLFFGSMLLLLMGILSLLKFMVNGKIGSKIFNSVKERPKTFWSILSMILLGIATPLSFYYDNLSYTSHIQKMSGCEDASYVKDAREGDRKVCEDDERDRYKKETIHLKEIPLMTLIIFLISGYFFIERSAFFKFLQVDSFRKILILISIVLLIAFITFQVNSNIFSTGEWRQGVTQPVIPEKFYMPVTITLTVIGFIMLFSLITVAMSKNDETRPDPNDHKSNLVWLILRLGIYFKPLLIMVLFFSIMGLLLSPLTKGNGGSRRFLSTYGNLLYLSIGLVVAVLVYQKIKGTDMWKNSKGFRIITNMLLIIPCLLWYIVEYFYGEITETPKIVYIILLGEFGLVSTYILVPIIMKYFFGYYVGKNNIIDYTLEKELHEKRLAELDDYFEQIKSKVVDVFEDKDWKKLMDQQKYTKNEIKIFIKNDIGKTQFEINKKKVDKKLDEDIAKLTSQPNYKSLNRYDQVVNFVYYLSSNKLGEENVKGKNNVASIEDLKTDRKVQMDIVDEKIKKGALHKSVVIIENPIYLDKEFIPMDKTDPYNHKKLTFQQLTGQNKNDYSYNYGLSLWVNLHAHAPSNFRKSYNSSANIINYGKNPQIMYNSKEKSLQIWIVKDNKIKTQLALEIKDVMTKQKWNNIIINYDLGTLDIFVNSKLVGTFASNIPHMADDPVIIGQGTRVDKGLAGGICNVVYYPSALTKTQIEFFYNTLKRKNPPII